MLDNRGKGRDSSPEGFEQALLKRIEQINIEPEMRAIAEHLREQAISEIEHMDDKCVDKQKLISSLKVLKSARSGEYLVVSEGDYGANIEFGTKNSTETPFLLPSFNKLGGLIHKCLQGALNRAALKARRFRPR
ncbi:MAG: hypothetical protein L3J67_08760 [Hyphomicrobiaceae bacterium]|nr:hypothetical protein [Hyphomicrobiaceae bacterium]